MVIALATIMLVWFGVQEALASAQGGPGFSLPKFISFFVLITFAYSFVKFYNSSIPGVGYSLKGFISSGTSSLVDYIGNDSTQEVQDTIRAALGKLGDLAPSFTEPYKLICTYTVQIALSILTALIPVIIAYGAIAATVVGILGPVFIPWLVFEKTDFLFWGWLKAFLGFEFPASRKPVPLQPLMMDELSRWRESSLYRSDQDYLFPSVQKNGTQPLQPEMVLRRHIRPALVRMGVTKKIGWHSFRHGFSNLLPENRVDVKVAQELLRHANSRITLDIYQRTVTDERRAAQELVFKDLLGNQNLETRKHPKPAHKEEVLSGSD